MKARILVVGSVNMDLVVRAARLPMRGETIRGDEFHAIPGGKGANQAVAASRLGGAVRMVGRVGEDTFGPALRRTLEIAEVDTAEVKSINDVATGVAFIILDATAQNSIIVTGGANLRLMPEDLQPLGRLFDESDAVLLQLETPLETVQTVLEMAKVRGVRTVLDAGPPTLLSPALLSLVDVLSPNETEAAALLGNEIKTVSEAEEASKQFLDIGVGSVVFKLGARGCMVVDRAGAERLPAYEVEAVDTTGAGDAFTAGLAVALGEGKSFHEAAVLASGAGALAVTKFGAQPSMPTRAEVEAFLASNPAVRK
jgi:ribokinase